MATAQDAISYARSFVGKVHEVPPGSNRTEIGKMFGWDGVSYCAEGVYDVFHHVGILALKTASAHLMVASGQNPTYGSLVTRFEDLLPCDVVGWNFDAASNIIPNIHHVSIASEHPLNGYIRHIGFNTSPPAGPGTEWNGDGCWEKSYPKAFFCCAWRPHLDGGHPGDNGHPRVRFEIGLGDKGADVRLWQHMLNVVDRVHLDVDGHFGKDTETATKRWQRAHDFKVDGTVLLHTIKTLEAKVAKL